MTSAKLRRNPKVVTVRQPYIDLDPHDCLEDVFVSGDRGDDVLNLVCAQAGVAVYTTPQYPGGDMRCRRFAKRYGLRIVSGPVHP